MLTRGLEVDETHMDLIYAENGRRRQLTQGSSVLTGRLAYEDESAPRFTQQELYEALLNQPVHCVPLGDGINGCGLVAGENGIEVFTSPRAVVRRNTAERMMRSVHDTIYSYERAKRTHRSSVSK